MFELRFSQAANDDLERLDRSLSKRIVRKVRFYVKSGRPLSFAKPLAGKMTGHYRFRIGAYRAIFYIEENGAVRILVIARIDNRDSVYE